MKFLKKFKRGPTSRFQEARPPENCMQDFGRSGLSWLSRASKKLGFTLVELMVAALAFSIVFGAVTGVMVMSIKYQKYNLAQNRLINEASYAIEYLARHLRMAQKDVDNNCGNGTVNYSIGNGGKQVEFLNYSGNCEEFRWDGISNQLQANLSGPFLPLISDDFEIINLLFTKAGDSFGDNRQPRITVTLELREKKLKDKPRIILQTTVSQRNLDM